MFEPLDSTTFFQKDTGYDIRHLKAGEYSVRNIVSIATQHHYRCG